MAQDFTNQQSTTHYNTVPDRSAKKNGKGCACCFVGCLVLFILILTPFVGGGIYISSLSDAEWGENIVSVLTNPSYSSEIKKAISHADNLTPEQRQSFVQLYDKFLTDYQSLPKENQDLIHRNVFQVIKKLFSDPKAFENKTPPELQEIIKALGLNNELSDFITATESKQNQLTPSVESATQPTYKTEYDF